MTRLAIHNETHLANAMLILSKSKLPVVVSIEDFHVDRSLPLNSLSHAWYSQISRTTKEDMPAQVKGFCKLHFGVPILRAESAEFCETYDRIIKPMAYETKLDIMSQPDWFPITSLMDNAQFIHYLEDIQKHYAATVQLVFPNEPAEQERG